MNKTTSKIDTTFLRFFAIAVIINSRLDDYYPISQLALDGMLGNSMFFMISGLGLSLSAQRKSRPFFSWLYRRLKRIYPAVLLVTFVYFILIKREWNEPFAAYLQLFVWPTPYSFLTQLLAYYAGFYFIAKLNSKRVYIGAIALLAVLQTYLFSVALGDSLSVADFLYSLSSFSWVFYAQTMLFGGYLGLIDYRNVRKRPQDFITLALLLVGYLGIKALMIVGIIPPVAYVTSHVIMLPILFYIVKCLCLGNVLQGLSKASLPYKFTTLVASITLELYVVHSCLLESGYAQALFFPLNVIVFVGTSIVISFIVNQICKQRPVPKQPRFDTPKRD